MNKEEKKVKVNKYGLIIQLILVLAVLILLILTAFDKIYLTIAEIVAGLALITMAYNNHTVYNRKYLTLVYIAFGILIIISGTVDLING